LEAGRSNNVAATSPTRLLVGLLVLLLELGDLLLPPEARLAVGVAAALLSTLTTHVTCRETEAARSLLLAHDRAVLVRLVVRRELERLARGGVETAGAAG
jgi:hypothetical protein